MKYYLIVGEASGDLHASNLMKEIQKKDSQAEFRFFGGDLMQKVGGTLVKHYKDMSFMGFLEVVQNLPTILNNLKECKKDIKNYQPDGVIFVDFPGFNLRLVPFVKRLGIKTLYYISPQLWAWKEGRIKIIRKFVDKMLVILPFEKEWYKERGVEVDFVGHPLLDALEHYPFKNRDEFLKENNLPDKPIIALLPGSRTQEIEKKLPIMLSIQKEFPEYQFLIAGAPSKNLEDYQKYLQSDISVVFGKTYDVLNQSHAALVTSGTATLETALINTPEVVCYKGSWLSYQIGKRVIKGIRFISLVNLIMDEELVKELIQNDLNYNSLKTELQKINHGEKRAQILSGYLGLTARLGGGGASKKAAEIIVNFL